MIDHPSGAIDYRESGSGRTLVLVPGSAATGAAWQKVIAAWQGGFRCVTASLPGYGGTAERRAAGDLSIDRAAETVEATIERAGGAPHLVGHSFGGLVAVAVALRRRVRIASLAVLEAPAVTLLREPGDFSAYLDVRAMTNAVAADHAAGKPDAIARMVDFFGGPGTFAAWPENARAYAIAATPATLRDWQSAYGFAPSRAALRAVGVPSLVASGALSHPAIRRANARLAESLRAWPGLAIPGAAHFMLATHARDVAALIGAHVLRAEAERLAA